MTLYWFEFKKYLTAWRRVLGWLVSAAATCALLIAGVGTLLERDGLFEPFSVGIVDNGGSPELRYVFDFFNDIVKLEYLDGNEARARLASGEIPAYVELPENFAADIFTGENTPFELHGDPRFPLQLALSKMLAAGGVAFLSASQAGIYATLDYAAEAGLPRAWIDQYVLLPINVAYMRQMLDYESFFSRRPTPFDIADPLARYGGMFAAFLILAGLLSFTAVLRGYTPAVYARYRLAGRSVFFLQWIRLAGLVTALAVCAVPSYGLAAVLGGWFTLPVAVLRGLALSVCTGAFGLMAAALFKSDAACGLFIFMASAGMLFFAGGMVPLAFLPRALHGLRFLSVPYWAAEGDFSGTLALPVFAVIFFGVACLVEIFSARVSRKA